ncbi:MAG: TCR/Tet family MFS transporter, partial [Chloroflexi bacterium]|nr:TCR/Tet family MFS transporter [Chloroflexota bacterium]
MEGRTQLDFRRILPVIFIVFVDLMGLTIIIPMLSLYAVSFGANEIVIGLLGASYPLMQFIGAPILGRLSDRFGRRPVLIVSQFGSLLGFILLGVASLPIASSLSQSIGLPHALWLLFVARMLDGFTGGNISIAQAVMTDSTTPETRTQGLALIGAAFGLGFIIGPVITSVTLALTNSNFAVPAFVAAGFSMLAVLLTIALLPETLPPEARGSDGTEATSRMRRAFSFNAMITALKRPQIGVLLITIFFYQLAFGGFQQTTPLFALNRLGLNAVGIGVVLAFVGVILVAVQGYFIRIWSRAVGDRALVLTGLALLGVGLFVMALTPRVAVPWY